MTCISLVISWRFFPFQNNPKILDPSYKMDLEFWDCFGRTKTHLMTEIHKAYLDIWGHFRDGKTLPYIQITVKILNIGTCMSEQTV